MTLQDMTKEQLLELKASNKWLEEKISEQAWDDAMWQQGEEYKLVGADAFDYHGNYAYGRQRDRAIDPQHRG